MSERDVPAVSPSAVPSQPTSTGLPGTPAPAAASGSWYQRLYARCEALATTPHALTAMLVVAIIDGSFFPIPPFALLVPMVFARPKAWWRLALAGTAASIFGGILGYGVGMLIRNGAIGFLNVDLNFRVHSNFFHVDDTLGNLLGEHLWSLTVLFVITPLYKLVTIGSGFVGVSFDKFIIASLVGRPIRFFVVAGAMAFIGPKARKWLRV